MRRKERMEIQRTSTANVLLTGASSMFLTHATFQRADRDLRMRVVNYLFGQHVSELRHLDVEARRGVVTLRGRVHTFHQKQLCLNCCQRVAGVLQIDDQIEVASPLP
jgi:osmotically-inducible protein OsmY